MSSSIREKTHCLHGKYCVRFHDRKHIDDYIHPFLTPCEFTPYHCIIHNQVSNENDHPHLTQFSHVCRFGTQCRNIEDSNHTKTSIHIHRLHCKHESANEECLNEEHLNTFTHSNIRDIRYSCRYGSECRNRRQIDHLAKYQHPSLPDDAKIVPYYNLNAGVNFVQNQHDNIVRVLDYIEDENWKSQSFKCIEQDVIDWIRTVRPVHRCHSNIFESIILHEHVMSRDYMEHLKEPDFVVDLILQNNQIRKIRNLRILEYKNYARDYVKALVTKIFPKNDSTTCNIYSSVSAQSKSWILLQFMSRDEFDTIKSTALAIAQAALKLHSNPTGIGYQKDKDLGTNKSIFSILGPNSGNYGNVFIVFKRDILHHPDTNFSIQSATSYTSGNAFKWRVWLGENPGIEQRQIELFHKTKLHASIPGYEYAAALEMIAVASNVTNLETINVKLDTVLENWKQLNSHQTIEAHLPSLIPLDYIEHVYMRISTFKSFNKDTQATIQSLLGNNITIVPNKHPDNYEASVRDYIIDKFRRHNTNSFSKPIRGLVITVPPSNFQSHCVPPLTISQAFEEYKIDHPYPARDISVYIYWQMMNGDMMLTLSSKHYQPNENQSNLDCLICYLAAKPSIINDRYCENASYLQGGRSMPLNRKDYAASSKEFYIGCNTNDLMSFCLEIQSSTGKVILSHSGANLIYNQKTISCTFDKAQLDLNQLNFIHVSAGTHSVPIRNLYVTFNKESEPIWTSTNEFNSNAFDQNDYHRSNRSLDKCKSTFIC